MGYWRLTLVIAFSLLGIIVAQQCVADKLV
jgi:uncharacterized membrane protein